MKQLRLELSLLLSFLIIIILILCPTILYAKTWILIDYGATFKENSYQLAGWNTVIKSPYTNYTTAGSGGLTLKNDLDSYQSYQGIQGTARTFSYGDQIVVTWYNNSDSETDEFTPLVSFTDPDLVINNEGEPQWYGMTTLNLPPYSSGRTTYDICDGSTGSIDHISAGTYSLVNICANVNLPNSLICDKIELNNEVDTVPPSEPQNLQATVLSDTCINLTWDAVSDNFGIFLYMIYQNGRLRYTSKTNHFVDMGLKPVTTYSYSITAVDAKRNASSHSNYASATTLEFQGGENLINPHKDMVYKGAFRLPYLPDDVKPQANWHYSGLGLTYYPKGDSADPDNGYPGSLFGVGHEVGCYVSEISIPRPIISQNKNVDDLNTAMTLQPFNDIFTFLDKDSILIPHASLEYCPKQGEQETDKLYLVYSDNYVWEKIPSHGWCELTLSNPQTQGGWYLGNLTEVPNYFAYSRYIFAIYETWAAAHTPKKLLITGKYRQGGLGGMGPTMFAIGPWNDGNPPPPGAELSYVRLLQYCPFDDPDVDTKSFQLHTFGDDWEDGAWITYRNKSAVILAGTKGIGEHWYGLPSGPWYSKTEFDIPEFEPVWGYKGWQVTETRGQILFYDPDDLAAVINGAMEPYEPQPYAVLETDSFMFNTKQINDVQKLMAIAFDRERGLLYAMEQFGDGTNSLIHVWAFTDA